MFVLNSFGPGGAEPILLGVATTVAGVKTYVEEFLGHKNLSWSEPNLAGEVSADYGVIVLVIEPVKILDPLAKEKV